MENQTLRIHGLLSDALSEVKIEPPKKPTVLPTMSPEVRETALRIHRLERELGPRYSMKRCRLETYQVYHKMQKPVIERLTKIAADPAFGEMIEEGAGFIFAGAVGTGKDHLLAAMMYAAATIHGATCRWVNGQELFGSFRDRITSDQREDELLRSFADPQVLGISDPIPPASDPTPYNLTQLYRLLDRRYRLCRPTWVTMNVSSSDEADRKLSEPVYDRLREKAEVFHCQWPSFREVRK